MYLRRFYRQSRPSRNRKPCSSTQTNTSRTLNKFKKSTTYSAKCHSDTVNYTIREFAGPLKWRKSWSETFRSEGRRSTAVALIQSYSRAAKYIFMRSHLHPDRTSTLANYTYTARSFQVHQRSANAQTHSRALLDPAIQACSSKQTRLSCFSTSFFFSPHDRKL